MSKRPVVVAAALACALALAACGTNRGQPQQALSAAHPQLSVESIVTKLPPTGATPPAKH